MADAKSSPSQRSAFMLVCVATICLATKGIFARLALDAGMTVAAVLLLRAACATPLFYLADRWRAAAKHCDRTHRDIVLAVACGFFFTLATGFDIYALSIMDVGVSRAILFTFPLFVQLFGLIHQRRLPERREIATFVVAYCGLILMLGLFDGTEMHLPLHGVVCVLCSAATYGAYLYYGRSVSLRLGANQFTFYSNVSTLLVFALLAPWVVVEADYYLPPTGLFWIACLVIFATVIPFILLFEGMRQIEAAPATLISMASPVISLSLAAYLFDERVTTLQMLGFVLVLAGVSLLKLPLAFLEKRQL